MNPARPLAALVAAVTLAGCATAAGPAPGAAQPTAQPAVHQMSVGDGCRYLHLDHDGRIRMPRVPALEHVARQADATAAARSLQKDARKVAADESAHSLGHLLRIVRDFTRLMLKCKGTTSHAASPSPPTTANA